MTGRLTDLDAVTIDAYGTLVELRDPVPALAAALAEQGIERADEDIAAAFAAEGAYYRSRSHEGTSGEGLTRLRLSCTEVFLAALDADIAPDAFADAFVAALEFEPLPGVRDALRALRSRGLALAVVSNWDSALPEHLERLGLRSSFACVVTSADAGAPKPDAALFLHALGRLGIAPARALHVGDDEADARGARAAGMRFQPAPLGRVLEEWR